MAAPLNHVIHHFKIKVSPLPLLHQRYQCSVSRTLDDVVVGYTGNTVAGVQCEEQGRANTSLWDATAGCDRGGVGVIDPDQLLPVGKEGAVPVDEMWIHAHMNHFGEQYVRLYCIECRGEVDERYPGIRFYLQSIQMF